MSEKPREFWVAEILPENYKEPFLAAYEGKPEQDKWMGWSVHVIEKSAADKLADALEEYVSSNEEPDRGDKADQALKDYRGEK